MMITLLKLPACLSLELNQPSVSVSAITSSAIKQEKLAGVILVKVVIKEATQ